MTVVKSLIPTSPSMPNKPMSEKECKALGLPSTSKAKARIGCPEDWEITWVQFALPIEDTQNLKALAKSLDVPVSEMCARIMVRWFEESRDEIYATAEASMRTASTEQELEKRAEAAMRLYERTVNTLRVKQAAKAAEAEASAKMAAEIAAKSAK